MNFADLLAGMLDNDVEVRPHSKREPYWGTLPRMCKICANRQEDAPPPSLKELGIKPAQYCIAYALNCFMAATQCAKTSPPVNFKVKKGTVNGKH